MKYNNKNHFPGVCVFQRMRLSVRSVLLQWIAVLESAAAAVQSSTRPQTWNNIKGIALQILPF